MIHVDKVQYKNSTIFFPRQEHTEVPSGTTNLYLYNTSTNETVTHTVQDVSGLSDYFVVGIYLQYLEDGEYEYTLEGVGKGLLYKGKEYKTKRQETNKEYTNNTITYKEYHG